MTRRLAAIPAAALLLTTSPAQAATSHLSLAVDNPSRTVSMVRSLPGLQLAWDWTSDVPSVQPCRLSVRAFHGHRRHPFYTRHLSGFAGSGAVGLRVTGLVRVVVAFGPHVAPDSCHLRFATVPPEYVIVWTLVRGVAA